MLKRMELEIIFSGCFWLFAFFCGYKREKYQYFAVYLFFYMFVNDQLMSGTIITANPNTIVFDINANNYLQPKPTKEATAREQICNLLTYRNIYQQFRI